AYDQPWKRQLEGTVGGYWGLFNSNRTLKYPAGQPISNFPLWKWQMAAGMVLCVLVFGAAWLTLRRRPWMPRRISWVAVAISATTAGVLLGVAADKMYYESYGFGGWLQRGALLAAGVVAPLLCANALMSGRPLPTFLGLLGPRGDKRRPLLALLLGAALVVSALIGSETALGLVFDPRYRDFPFAALTMAVVPFATLLLNRPQQGERPLAESVFAGLLGLSALYIGINEGEQNWQSLWTCAIYVLFAITLWRARVVQSPK
ncbi:MAG: beta-(1-6) glucans synthase, partial [Bradyrhizobium sp.]